MRSTVRFTVSIFLMCLLQIPAKCADNETIDISGFVRTTRETGLKDVTVKVWRDSREVASTKTDGEGRYEIKGLNNASSIDAITYDPHDLVTYGPAVVKSLSGRDVQRLSVVIFTSSDLAKMVSSAMNEDDTAIQGLLNQSQAFEAIVFVQSKKYQDGNSFAERYGGFFEELPTPEPPGL